MNAGSLSSRRSQFVNVPFDFCLSASVFLAFFFFSLVSVHALVAIPEVGKLSNSWATTGFEI